MEINPYIGIRGTYASYFQQNPNRKIERAKETSYAYNVKPISKVCQIGDRENTQNNDIQTNKREQLNNANLSFEEILKNTINILI